MCNPSSQITFAIRIVQGILLSLSIFLYNCREISLPNAQNDQKDHWPRHTIDASLDGADGVKLLDVNEDGLLDIVTGWEESGIVKIYTHPGFENVFRTWPSVNVGNTPSIEDAVLVDLDEDGAADVISCTEGESRKMFVHWAPNSFKDYLDSSKWVSEVLPASDNLMQWMFAVPVQLDGFNGIDIIAGGKGPKAQIGWFEAPENPRSISDWKWHPLSQASWIMSIYLKDMDFDGDLDIVYSDRKTNPNCGVYWLENPGIGKNSLKLWDKHLVGAKNREVMFIDIADLDRDGLEDIIIPEYKNELLIYFRRLDESGKSWEESYIPLPKGVGLGKSVRVGNIDGNNRLDIVYSSELNKHSDPPGKGIVWGSIESHKVFSNITWSDISGPVGYKFDMLELIDMDGDNDLDVLTCEENYGESSSGLGVIWYENPHIRD